MYNGEFSNANLAYSSRTTPTSAYINNAWSKPGDITVYPKISQFGSYSNTSTVSSLYVEDASFVRLRNIRLTYHFSNSTLFNLKSNSISLYVFANNIAKWTNYDGYDPEMAITNGTTAGNDTGRYPQKREIGAGVEVTF